VLSTPFLVPFPVLAKDHSQAHTCAPIAVIAGHAKAQHAFAKFVPPHRPLAAGPDLDTARTDTNGLSKRQAARSKRQN
jgi:hypothetical protein